MHSFVLDLFMRSNKLLSTILTWINWLGPIGQLHIAFWRLYSSVVGRMSFHVHAEIAFGLEHFVAQLTV